MPAETGNDKQQQRTVRSFVRRTGRMTTAQTRAMQELWPQFGIDYADQHLNCESVYGRNAPTVLEIGFGNGETLVEQAAGDPDRDYLGIEVHEPGVGHCLLHIEAAAISNLRLIAHDALEVLADQIADASLARINLYFADPWPKKRHHKRRIVNPDFLALCATRLDLGGSLHIATDWAGYAEHIDEQIAHAHPFEIVERREHSGDRPLERPTTKFERRGLKRGHAIVDWKLARI
ncbi:MAG: tRNA (guanosine(46)-N7)-methyltransferase TrmB [Woeseia sp.]